MAKSTLKDDHLSPAARQQPRLKIWFEVEGDYSFGLGICEILQAVEATGSIKAAAASLGKSYRHVWGRVKDAEKTLQQSLVTTHVGGRGRERSSLTEFARQAVQDFLKLRQRLSGILEREFADRCQG